MGQYNVVVDLETTGFTPHSAGVTEITMYRVNEDFTKSKILVNTLTNPGGNVPKKLEAFNGISTEMVRDKEPWIPLFKKLIKKLIEKDAIIYAWNTDFEKQFFEYAADEGDFEKLRWADGAAIFVHQSDTLKNRFSKGWRLEVACKQYGIDFDTESAHRAEYDVQMTIKALAAMYDPNLDVEEIYNKFSAYKFQKVSNLKPLIEDVKGWDLRTIRSKISEYFNNGKSLELFEQLIVECKNVSDLTDERWIQRIGKCRVTTNDVIKWPRERRK